LFITSGNNGRFSGGFDINVFQQVHKTGKVSSVVSTYLYSESNWCYGFWDSCFLAGDLSLMPEVSVELVCNLMEGI